MATPWKTKTLRKAAALVASGMLLTHTGPPAQASAGFRRFDPAPSPAGQFSIVSPAERPDLQRRITSTAPGFDGARDSLYYETWLPGPAADGTEPPAKVPAIVTVTPYVKAGVLDYDNIPLAEAAVSRGYAYVQAHIRGSGSSGGCLDDANPADLADFVEDIAVQGWSDGIVGMYGISHRGQTALEAVTVAPKAKMGALKAVVAGAPWTNHYDYRVGMDGVPIFMSGSEGIIFPELGHLQGAYPGYWDQPVERETCAPRRAGLLTTDGSMTPYFESLDFRREATTVTVPVLLTHGFGDANVYIQHSVGFFDQIPKSTPKKAIFGNFSHEWPDGRNASRPEPWDTVPEWTRTDWVDMVIAWYDHFLRGLDTGVGSWPTVQVQSNDGQWREERDWPWSGQRAGWLALGPGVLGAQQPTGASSYREGAYRNAQITNAVGGSSGHPDGSFVRFESEPLAGPLAITGQPVLDLWVSLDRDDAHLTAALEIFDAQGTPVEFVKDQGVDPSYWKWSNSTVGARSMKHLDALQHNRFVQQMPASPEGTTPVSGTKAPVRVQLRFQPRDWIVPAGGKVVVTIAGSMPWRWADTAGFNHPFQLSGSAAKVTIHHDCANPSALRFLLREENPTILAVSTATGASTNRAEAAKYRALDTTAGGLAVAPVCGRQPDDGRPSALGPLRL